MKTPRAPRESEVVLVAGPRLRHAKPELSAVAGLYSNTVTLAGKDATVAAVMEARRDQTVSVTLFRCGGTSGLNPRFRARAAVAR